MTRLGMLPMRLPISLLAVMAFMTAAPTAGATSVKVVGTELQLGLSGEVAAEVDPARSLTVTGGADGSIEIVETGMVATMIDDDGAGGCVVLAPHSATCPSVGLVGIAARYTGHRRVDFSGLDSLPVLALYGDNSAAGGGTSVPVVAFGGPGNDQFWLTHEFSGGDGPVKTKSGEAHGGPGNDRIVGAAIAFGDAGNDVITDKFQQHARLDGTASGGDGNDRIDAYFDADGGPGNDVMTSITHVSVGGAGNDTLIGDNITILRGDAGDDYLAWASLADGGDGDDRIVSARTARGGAGADNISGARSASGGEGNDTLWRIDTFGTGGNGDDVLIGGFTCTSWKYGNCVRWSARSRLFGGAGNDRILRAHDGQGGLGNDVVSTVNSRAGDSADGGAGRDKCSGDRGDSRSTCEA